MGLLKVLLGKPGTLHSPGHIFFPSALGVPPDLRDASGFWGLVKDHGRVGTWLRPHRSRGSGVPQLPGKGRSLAQSAFGTGSQPVCLATLYLLFNSRPIRAFLCHFLAVAHRSGGEVPVGSFGACTPPHRQPLCGVAGSTPVQNGILN